MSKVAYLMGLTFLSIFLVSMLGNLALTNAEFDCPEFVKEYKALGGEEISGTELQSEVEDYDVSGLESGKIQEEEILEVEVEETLEEPSIKEKITNFFTNLKTLLWEEVFSPTSEVLGFVTSPGKMINYLKEQLMKIPFVKELGYLFLGIRLLIQPCSGLAGISFIVFTPLVLGLIYMIASLVRGGS